MGTVFERIKGKTFRFKCKVEGDKWYHSGESPAGTTVEEVWKRVEKK